MKIAIITSGVLPVPAIKGGAVETLTDLFIMQNEKFKNHKLIVYSVFDERKIQYEIKSKHIEYINIKTTKTIYKIKNLFYNITTKISHQYKGNEYIDKVIKDLKRREIDYIMIENNPLYAITIKKKIPHSKIIQHLHNSYITEKSKFLKEILANNDYIFGVSNYIQNEVISVCSNKQCNNIKVFTWYNAINEQLFNKVPSNNLKTELGFLPTDFIILFSGRIVEVKGIDKLLEAMNYLTNYPNIKLLIIGGTSFANSKRTPFLDHIHELCKIHKEQIIITGYINYNLTPLYYDLADVCIFPSMWNEPFALTALEAMTIGKPMIVTNSGGLTEVVDSQCAIILEKNDDLIFNIAKSIEILYHSKALRHSMSQHAKERAKHFSSEVFYNRFNELLNLLP